MHVSWQKGQTQQNMHAGTMCGWNASSIKACEAGVLLAQIKQRPHLVCLRRYLKAIFPELRQAKAGFYNPVVGNFIAQQALNCLGSFSAISSCLHKILEMVAVSGFLAGHCWLGGKAETAPVVPRIARTAAGPCLGHSKSWLGPAANVVCMVVLLRVWPLFAWVCWLWMAPVCGRVHSCPVAGREPARR